MKIFVVLSFLLALLGSMLVEANAQRPGCFCPEVFQPVCGKNGRTYGNSCKASCAGVGIRHDGAC